MSLLDILKYVNMFGSSNSFNFHCQKANCKQIDTMNRDTYWANNIPFYKTNTKTKNDQKFKYRLKKITVKKKQKVKLAKTLNI